MDDDDSLADPLRSIALERTLAAGESILPFPPSAGGERQPCTVNRKQDGYHFNTKKQNRRGIIPL